MPVLKHVAYYMSPTSKFIAQVAYKIFDNKYVVFTACQNVCHGSTINHAENIIRMICQEERISWLDHRRWFDLQTRLSYGKTGKPCQGDFEFDEIVFKDTRCIWLPTKCPTRFFDPFKELYIDGPPRQVGFHIEDRGL